MKAHRILRDKVQIVRVTEGETRDRYNNPQAEEKRKMTRASLEQTDEQEVTVGRDTQISDWTALLPRDAKISGRDQIVWNGRTFEVIGPPALRRGVGGKGAFLFARLRYIDG